jgi:proteasome lid subunit RPN8/RPN11
MNEYKIKKETLLDAISASKNMYPKEFMCFLSSTKNNNLIDEIVLFPTYNSENSASVNLHDIPIGMNITGSLHSHPSGHIIPSKADLKFFRLYEINIIIASKMDFYFKVFNKFGEEISIDLV